MSESPFGPISEEELIPRILTIDLSGPNALFRVADGLPVSEEAKHIITSAGRTIDTGHEFADASGCTFAVTKDALSADVLHKLSYVLTAETGVVWRVQQA